MSNKEQGVMNDEVCLPSFFYIPCSLFDILYNCHRDHFSKYKNILEAFYNLYHFLSRRFIIDVSKTTLDCYLYQQKKQLGTVPNNEKGFKNPENVCGS
jgi:hypothetical protein